MAESSKSGEDMSPAGQTVVPRRRGKEHKMAGTDASRTTALGKPHPFYWSVRPAAIVLVVIMLVGVWFRCRTTVWDFIQYPDTTQYLRFADDISHLRFLRPEFYDGNDFGISRELLPLYPLLIAMLAGLPMELHNGGIFISFLMSVLTFLPVFLLARHLHSSLAGVIAVALLGFWPFVLRYATLPLTESTFTFLLTTSCCCAMLALEQKHRVLFAIAGACCALTYLARETGFVSIAILVAGIPFYFRFVDNLPWRRIVGRLGISVGAFLLVSMPYLVYVKVQTGQFGIATRMSTAQIQAYVLASPEGEGPRQQGADDPAGVASKISRIITKIISNGGSYAIAFAGEHGTAIIVLVCLSWAWSVWQGFRQRSRVFMFRELFLNGWVIAILVIYGTVTERMIDVRYMSMIPADVILCGVGIARWSGTLIDWLPPQALRRNSRVRAAQWVPAVAGLDVVCRKPFAGYFLKAGRISRFPESPAGLSALEADLLVADSYTVRTLLTPFLDLAYGSHSPLPGTVIYSRLFPQYKKVITVYDLREPGTLEAPPATGVAERLQRARNHFDKDNLWDAMVECRAILRRQPDHSQALRALIKTHERYFRTIGWPNDLVSIRIIYERYLALDPDDPESRKFYQLLKAEIQRRRN